MHKQIKLNTVNFTSKYKTLRTYERVYMALWGQ